MARRFLFLSLFVISLSAQTTPISLPASVTAQGSSTINVVADQAQLSVSITTNGTTAQDAGQQNATLAAVVVTALQKLGTVATVSYNVSPRYSNGTSTQAPAIVGYSATISEQLTLTDLSLIGKAIDVANQAGATNVGNLTLGLQNPEPSLQAALTAAAKQALTHAASIASGLGGKIGPVISAQEATSYTPITVLAGVANAATSVQPGPVSVSATVTVTAQLQ